MAGQKILLFLSSLVDPALAKGASKVALLIGTLLLLINHGVAIFNHQMTTSRWISAGVSYLIPYLVGIHGRSASQQKK